MYEFGTIVLVPFPYTDLSATKVRPALIVTNDNHIGEDVIVCFITTKVHKGSAAKLILESNTQTGLKTQSVVRFDKIATLSKKVILGELGKVAPEHLQKHQSVFTKVFGFSREDTD